MANYVARSVNIGGFTLEAATAALNAVLNDLTAVTAVFPVTTRYSVDVPNDYRVQKTDAGIIVVGVEKPRRREP